MAAILSMLNNDPADPGHTKPLEDRALIARLHIERPWFRKTDRVIERKVAKDTNSDPRMHSHRRSLLANGSLSKIQTVISAAATYHREHTLPWEDDGVRVLPTATIDDYMEVMRKYEREFHAAVAEFLPNYPMLIEQAKELLGDTFNENDYPHPMKIASKFDFEVKISNLNIDFRCSSISKDREAEIRAEIEARTEKTLRETVRNLFQQAHEHVTHMVERLHAYNKREDMPPEERTREGIFHNSLVDNLKEFVDRLPALNLTGDPEIEEMRIKLLRQLCAHSPEDLRNSPATRTHVLRQAEAMLKATSELI